MNLKDNISTIFATELAENVLVLVSKYDELKIVIHSIDYLIPVCKKLCNHPDLKLEMLIDLCAVDYSQYGKTEWDTGFTATNSGSFGRARHEPEKLFSPLLPERFAIVYHLLSIQHNWRLRVKIFIADTGINACENSDNLPIVPSVTKVWRNANWYEREAYDLFGIKFSDHPDLRRILTDYEFNGYPMRKDFPQIGTVEARYDAELGKVIYEPVSIAPRVLVPKVIRNYE